MKKTADHDVTDHDVITISETWLSADIKNNEISVNGYHPPVRKDRSDDPHGGVAVYVKNSLICKERHDLSIPQLEAVWIETKIGQDKLLIGSFFAGEQFPTDLSAGALTVKEATKAGSNLVRCGCVRTYDSCYLGLG